MILPARQHALNLGLFAIVKDEAPYLEEWIAHHHATGVTHFFIADNGSTDGSRQILQRLQKNGICRVVEFSVSAGQPPQLAAYQLLANRFASEVHWMAFIDADEFIITDETFASIPDFLATFEPRHEIGAIALNWACFGSAGRLHYEQGFVVRQFDQRAEQHTLINHHYKSLVRSAAFAGIGGNPHHFRLKKNYSYATSDGQALSLHPDKGAGLSATVEWNNARINHYVVKSHQEFFEKKAPRGRATIAGQHRGEEYFRGHDRNEFHEPFPPHLLEKLEKAHLTITDQNTPLDYSTATPNGLSGFQETPSQLFYHAAIDHIERLGTDLQIKGWAFSSDGAAAKNLQLIAAKQIIPSKVLATSRPDVTRIHPEANGHIGFTLSASLLEPDLMQPGQASVDICSDGVCLAQAMLPKALLWHGETPPSLQSPAIPVGCVQTLKQAMQSARVYLEFGTGSMTNIAADHPALNTVSIGCDWEILRAVKHSVTSKNADNRTTLLYADIGPTGDNGFPLDASAFKDWHQYPINPWLHCATHHLQPDLILIDGRFRRACLFSSLIFAAPATRIFVDDYLDRPYYHTVEKFIRPTRMIDRMAEFNRPTSLEHSILWLNLLEAISDPR